jgi:hypothetical protein
VLAGEITGDHAAQHDPRLRRQPPKHGAEDGPSDVVEVDVDTAWAVLLECHRHIVLAVVDARVEPEFVDHHPAFLGAAGDPHHPSACELGDLARHRAGGARGGRDHYGLPRVWPADVGHPEVGGGTGRPVNRHHGRLVDFLHAGDRGAEHVVADDDELLKARQGGDHVADGIGVTSRRDDLADPGSADDLAELHGRQIARLVVEPRPRCGVQPDVGGADKRLTVGGFGRGQRDELGVGGLDQPIRTPTEHDLAVHQVGHGVETTQGAGRFGR